MNDVISKELLSEVLDKEVTNIKMHHINDEYIYFDYIGKQSRIVNEVSIDIYKLAHKCKEWAYKQGYILMSTIRTNSSLAICEFSKSGKHDYEDELYNNFRAHTEHEAVFLACEWILENNTTRDNV